MEEVKVISLEEVEALKAKIKAENDAWVAEQEAQKRKQGFVSGVKYGYVKEDYISAMYQQDAQNEPFRYGEVRYNTYRTLFNKEKNAYRIIDNLMLPPPAQRLDWKILEETLLRNTQYVIQSYIQSSSSLDVSAYAYTTKEQLIDMKYQMGRIYNSLDDIATIIVSATSNFILAQLMFYIDRSHIFLHIKENVLRPNVRKFMEIARETLMDQDLSETIEDIKGELNHTVEEYIHAMLIAVDTKKIQSTREKLLTYRDRFYKDLDAAFATCEYLMPQFMIDLVLFTTNAEEIKAYNNYVKFLETYKLSLTLEANRAIFRKYCNPDIVDTEFEKKLKHTIQKRNSFNGIYLDDDKLIDGITFDEMNMIIRACSGRLDPDDRAMLNGTKYAKRVFEIIDQHGGINYSWYLKEHKLARKDNFSKKEVLYEFRTDKFDIDVNEDIRRFPEFIKNSLYKDADVRKIPECFIHQTGYVINSMTKPEIVEELLVAYKGMDKKEKLAQRLSTINNYLIHIRKFDPDRVDYLQSILNDYEHVGPAGPISKDYIDIGINPIIASTTEELIEKLVIVEGMWRMLCEAQEKRRKKLAKLTYSEYDPSSPPEEKKNDVIIGEDGNFRYSDEELTYRRSVGIPDDVTIPRIPVSKDERNKMLDAEIARLNPQGMIFTGDDMHPNINFLTRVTDDIYYDKGMPPLKPIVPRDPSKPKFGYTEEELKGMLFNK